MSHCLAFAVGANLDALIGGGALLKIVDRIDSPKDTARAVDRVTPDRGGLSCGHCSFGGSTGVLMADGTVKPIAEIVAGDEVWAEDPVTGEAAGRVVTDVWVHVDELVVFETEAGSLVTTEDHPFWNDSVGVWEGPETLGFGDTVTSAVGLEYAVVGLVEGSTREAAAFNLSVDGLHTFFVVTDTGVPLLVHNCGDSGDGGDALRGTNARGETTSRPSGFRRDTLDEAWDSAEVGPNGGRLCPASGCDAELVVPPNQGVSRDWDASHNPSWTNREFPRDVDRPTVLDNYNQGVGLECVTCNRSGGNNDDRFGR